MVDGISKNSLMAGLYEAQQKNKTENTSSSSSLSLNSGTENDLQSLTLASNDPEEQIKIILKEIELLEQQLENIKLEEKQLVRSVESGAIKNNEYEAKFSEISSRKTGIFNKISSKLNDITNVQSQAEINAGLQQSVQNTTGNYNFSNYDSSGGDISLGGSELGNAAAQFGLSFVGKINTDSQGNARFSNGRQEAWCADFVTTIYKETFAKMGKSVPAGFGSAAVSGLMDWGKKNGRYTDTASMSSQQRSQYIAQNIKPGDILIQKRNGRSHTGIVVKVYPDGSFDTVEGNTSDSVRRRSYKADDKYLSGFVKMA